MSKVTFGIEVTMGIAEGIIVGLVIAGASVLFLCRRYWPRF